MTNLPEPDPAAGPLPGGASPAAAAELTPDTRLAVARAWVALRAAYASLPPDAEWPLSRLDLRQAELCLTDIEPDPAAQLRGLTQPHGSIPRLLAAAVSYLDWIPAPQRTPEILLGRMYVAALLERLCAHLADEPPPATRRHRFD